MTPQHLHAIANLWSLAKIWPSLASASQRADRASGDDRGTVQAWRPGSGVHSGRTGDQILDAILRGTGTGANPYLERLERSAATIAWLAAKVVPPTAASTPDAIREMLAGVTDLRPNAALQLAMHIGAEDRAIRRLLSEPDDQAPLPRVVCPACRTPGSLALRGSNPVAADRPIVCGAFSCTRDTVPSIWSQAELASTMMEAA
jgi:hypothetical protein